MQLLIRFFSFEERSFKNGSGKQIAMYRRIYSKRKHGAFCIEILQRFQGNRNCSIFAFTDQHVFLVGVSCHNVNFLVLCHQRPIEEAKKGNCPSKFLRTRYSLQHASKASEQKRGFTSKHGAKNLLQLTEQQSQLPSWLKSLPCTPRGTSCRTRRSRPRRYQRRPWRLQQCCSS